MLSSFQYNKIYRNNNKIIIQKFTLCRKTSSTFDRVNYTIRNRNVFVLYRWSANTEIRFEVNHWRGRRGCINKDERIRTAMRESILKYLCEVFRYVLYFFIANYLCLKSQVMLVLFSLYLEMQTCFY